MIKFTITVFIIFNTSNIYSQNLKDYINDKTLSNYEINTNKDSLNLWEYKYDNSYNGDNKLGELILQRKEYIKNNITRDSLLPRIKFFIYPSSYSDSISQLETTRGMKLSCLYPNCGATIIDTKKYIFWSDPYSIDCTLKSSINKIDYTRWNAKNVLRKAINKDYASLKDLINNLPIKKNELLTW